MHRPNFFHNFIQEVDTVLRTLLPPKHRHSERSSPAAQVTDNTLSLAEKKHVAGLMRVNHAGEVCAQALYQGQALTAQLTEVREQMLQASQEEVDHLSWCEQRLNDLDSAPSILNVFWYPGSFLIGALAGMAGDKYSLGFVAETERQVSHHLQKHLSNLPSHDLKTRAILEQMHQDEMHHAKLAVDAGATELPKPIQLLMKIVSKIMTKSSYHI